jgi:MFS transporter, PAT family, beta-lactamase induction signal transducer AmpG
VLGYRIALLATSFLALVLADFMPWNLVYLLMALLMVVGIIATLWAPAPPLSEGLENHAPPTPKDLLTAGAIALIVGGLLTGVLTQSIPLTTFYWAIGGLIAIWLFISFLGGNKSSLSRSNQYSLNDAIYQPFQEFFQRFGATQGGLVLLFILLYKLGDALVGNMANPFLVEMTFTKTQIGAIQGGLGFFATTIGVLAGGAAMTRWGINRCLWVFGVLQLLSNFGYYALAIVGKDERLLILAINIENFCAGLVTVVSVAFLMRLCDRRFTTTQFALFSSLMAISRDILSTPAGALAEITGWSNFFLITAIAAIPGLLLLPLVAPWNPQPPIVPRPGLDG